MKLASLLIVLWIVPSCEAGFFKNLLDFIMGRRRDTSSGPLQGSSNPEDGPRVAVVGGGNDWSCEETLDCWTIVEEPAPNGASCVGPCGKKVCLEFTGGGDCPDAVSHVCDQADSDGCPRPDGSWDSTSSNTAPCDPFSNDKCEGDPPIGTEMCQYGEPGQTLYWIVKKGSNNQEANGFEDDGSKMCYLFDDWTPTGYDPTNSEAYDSCSGNTAAQRVVEYTVPPDPSCVGPPPCVTIDFGAFEHGEYVPTLLPFESFPGITMSVRPAVSSDGCEGVPRIYDTSRDVNPEDIDPELEDPDLDCVNAGKTLIIQEGPCVDDRLPDDAELGGVIFLDFQFPVDVKSVTLLETEGTKTNLIRTTNTDGVTTKVRVPAVGDCGIETFDVVDTDVVRLSVKFPESGGIGDLTICLPAPGL